MEGVFMENTSPHELPGDDPVRLFDLWLSEAQTAEPNDPNACALATSTPEGVPSVRMVLAKPIGDRRFCLFTNAGSQKGQELALNPRAALCFHWKTLRRQVRVSGPITRLDDSAVDTYFHSRSRSSQIAAAVSSQSQPLASREALETSFHCFEEDHPGVVPRPSFWIGYHLAEERMEFWIDGAHRLHDRFLFTRSPSGWRRERLYP
jgi:pyridoxamine 5'-phosphate oxidase